MWWGLPLYLLGVITTPVVLVAWTLWSERAWKKRAPDDSYHRMVWD
jgi:hypothetical protein